MDKSSFNLHIIRDFLDTETCRELIAEIRRSPSSLAPTYGKGEAGVDEQVRRVCSVSVAGPVATSVSQRLEEQRASIATHFGTNLDSFEEPQFLRYRVGDFFVAHQDGNTGLINLETDRSRRISVSIFLNSQAAQPGPETYCGGSVVFLDWRGGSRQEVFGEAGMLMAFPSETTHEVTPVTHGERYAIVTWYRV